MQVILRQTWKNPKPDIHIWVNSADCRLYFYIVLTLCPDWSWAPALIWNAFPLETELCCIQQLALHQTISSTYNITPVLLRFVQHCVFKPNNLENACFLLGHGNCQRACVTEQTVSNFLFPFSSVFLSLLAKETLRLFLLSSTGEPLDNQTAPGLHAKICGSCLWYFKSGKEIERGRKDTCAVCCRLLLTTYRKRQYQHVSTLHVSRVQLPPARARKPTGVWNLKRQGVWRGLNWAANWKRTI